MKFGKQLEEYELPEWRGHYVPYKQLKRRLEALKDFREEDGQQTAAAAQASEEWQSIVEKEALRVGDFVDRGLRGLEAQLHDLGSMAAGLRNGSSQEPSADEGSFMRLRVLEAISRVAEGSQRLRGFAELNHAALYKILKKHDKQQGVKDGLSQIFPMLVKQTRLSDSSRFDDLDAELKKLSMDISQMDGLDASPEVVRLAVGLGRSRQAPGEGTSQPHRNEMLLSFFMGSSLALFISIGVLLFLPEKSSSTFSEADFLTPMPVFRVAFSVLLILWCMGAVTRVCDKWDINHMFILGVDPRCRVSADYYFSRAAGLTTCWIFIFGMYVADYKWRLIPPVWSERGYNERSSFHFVLYPAALLSLTLVGLAWPSKICRNRYKASILGALRRTAFAPLYSVDFCDNLIGDVLTSLAKPLQDVPKALCYLNTSHPQDARTVERFVLKGDTCHYWTHHEVLPVIAGLPYLFRALQCLRRYRDTRENRNLWNFFKYVSSLLVVVVSSVPGSPLWFVALVSAIATVYAGAWDVAMDWGLGRRDLFDLPDHAPRRSNTLLLEENPTSPSGHIKPVRVERPERQFPRQVYWLCILLDLAARSTWVLTLMPSSIITGSIVGRVVLVSFISSVEIMRRSMWTVLRIEHEQVANASGFRALLWVPSKLNALEKRPTQLPVEGLKKPLLA